MANVFDRLKTTQGAVPDQSKPAGGNVFDRMAAASGGGPSPDATSPVDPKDPAAVEAWLKKRYAEPLSQNTDASTGHIAKEVLKGAGKQILDPGGISHGNGLHSTGISDYKGNDPDLIAEKGEPMLGIGGPPKGPLAPQGPAQEFGATAATAPMLATGALRAGQAVQGQVGKILGNRTLTDAALRILPKGDRIVDFRNLVNPMPKAPAPAQATWGEGIPMPIRTGPNLTVNPAGSKPPTGVSTPTPLIQEGMPSAPVYRGSNNRSGGPMPPPPTPGVSTNRNPGPVPPMPQVAPPPIVPSTNRPGPPPPQAAPPPTVFRGSTNRPGAAPASAPPLAAAPAPAAQAPPVVNTVSNPVPTPSSAPPPSTVRGFPSTTASTPVLNTVDKVAKAEAMKNEIGGTPGEHMTIPFEETPGSGQAAHDANSWLKDFREASKTVSNEELVKGLQGNPPEAMSALRDSIIKALSPEASAIALKILGLGEIPQMAKGGVVLPAKTVLNTVRSWEIGKTPPDRLSRFILKQPNVKLSNGESFNAFKRRVLGSLKSSLQDIKGKAGHKDVDAEPWVAKLVQAWAVRGYPDSMEIDSKMMASRDMPPDSILRLHWGGSKPIINISKRSK